MITIEQFCDRLANCGLLREAASLADISWEDDYYVAKIGKPSDWSIFDYARQVVQEGLTGQLDIPVAEYQHQLMELLDRTIDAIDTYQELIKEKMAQL